MRLTASPVIDTVVYARQLGCPVQLVAVSEPNLANRPGASRVQVTPPDRPTARPPDRPTARPPDRPTARPPDCPTARLPDRPTA